MSLLSAHGQLSPLTLLLQRLEPSSLQSQFISCLLHKAIPDLDLMLWRERAGLVALGIFSTALTASARVDIFLKEYGREAGILREAEHLGGKGRMWEVWAGRESLHPKAEMSASRDHRQHQVLRGAENPGSSHYVWSLWGLSRLSRYFSCIFVVEVGYKAVLWKLKD